MARNTSKSKAMEELTKALGWPRMPAPQEGVYFSVDGAKLVLDMLKGKGKDGKPVKPPKPETKEEVQKRIAKRFEMLGQYTEGTLKGNFRSLIVQGPPGLGKTYTVDSLLKQYDPNEINTTRIAGKITAVQLFKQLWDHRNEGQILVLDDCDNVFFDDIALNLLKAAVDTSKKRVISYLTEDMKISEKDGSIIDKRFEFNGTIIFITNYDFDEMIERGHRLAPHFEALKSRSMYVTLGMKTRKDYMVRVEQIADLGALFAGKSAGCKKEVLEYMNKNLSNLDEVSARMAVKISNLREAFPKTWEMMASESCFRKDMDHSI